MAEKQQPLPDVIQSVYRRAAELEAFDLVVIDEAHTVLLSFWGSLISMAFKHELYGTRMVTASLNAVPYLLRRRQWKTVFVLLDHAMRIDNSPEILATILPQLRLAHEHTKGSDGELPNLGIIATALLAAGHWPEAEEMMRQVLKRSRDQGDFRTVAVANAHLLGLLRSTGRAKEALRLIEDSKDDVRRAGLGPWTKLETERMRLDIMNEEGHYSGVLNRIQELRSEMDSLSEELVLDETVFPCQVREAIFDTGLTAARQLANWELALAFNQESVSSKQRRNAPDLELAGTRFNDYASLIGLKRYPLAQKLLNDSLAIFEAEKDLSGLGKAFGGLADLEYSLGHYAQASEFAETSLMYAYLVADPEDCAARHHNLSVILEQGGQEQKQYISHCLAGALIYSQIGSGVIANALPNLAIAYAAVAPQLPDLPRDFDELCRIIEETEGAHFRELFERLPRRAATGDEAFQDILAKARELAAQEPPKSGEAPPSPLPAQ